MRVLSFAVSGERPRRDGSKGRVPDQLARSTSTGGVQASTVDRAYRSDPGENTFTLQYKTEGGTGEFTNRSISVIPLG